MFRAPCASNKAIFYFRNFSINDWLTTQKQSLIGKYREVIRKKVIDQAQVEIALAGKHVADYTPEQLEIIVKDQVDKIIQK